MLRSLESGLEKVRPALAERAYGPFAEMSSFYNEEKSVLGL